MSDEPELTPEQKFTAEDPEVMVPRALLAGRHPDAIVQDLVRLDWSPAAAQALVERVADDLQRFHSSPESRQKLLAEARRDWLAGCLLVLLGLGALVFGLLLVLSGQIFFLLLPLALFVVGMVMASRGWGRWRYYSRLPIPDEKLRRTQEESK